MLSLIANRWVGPNTGSVFRRLWTKVNRIKFACAGVSVVCICNAVFRLTMSCCVSEIFAIKSRSCVKSRRNFDVFGPTNFGELAIQIYDRININKPSNTWQSLVTIGQVTSEIRRRKKERKKEDLNYSGKTECRSASIAGVPGERPR